MRMDVILQRWLPIVIIMAACYGLIFSADTKIAGDIQNSDPPIAFPADPADYKVPPLPRDPFQLGPKEEPKTDAKTGEPVKKREIDPASLLYLNAIFWDETTPMVSINGKVLGIGGEYSSNIKVQTITQNSVVLMINGRPVTKFFKD
ncbi:MAG: hypothetical protein PHW69_05635 [Elusimicrobiaceae bacterium]|nr:hypothetical protein [Elusimicrobiaceae bacterium]